MTKTERIQKERARLAEILKDIDENKRALVDGLIDQAAYLTIENNDLQESLVITGMVKIHPQNPGIQKPVEAAKQYRQNVNTYAVIIKTLNGVLMKDAGAEEDAFDEWVKSRQQQNKSDE